MKFFCLLITFLFIFEIVVMSQGQNIKVESECNSDKSVSFKFEKKNFGTYYLQLNFKYLENANSIGYKGNITGYTGKLITIKPIDPQKPISFSYNYSYIRGKLNAKIDTGFVYLLPVSRGKTINVLNHSFLYSQYFGSQKPRNWKSFKFEVSEGDTVFSSRKGLVVEVNEGFDPDTAVVYASKNNAVLIEHEDGSFARYSVLKKGSVMVKPGETVYPHTPIAIAGTFNRAGDTQISFQIYYLVEDNIEKKENSIKNMQHYFSYVDPVFHTSSGDMHLKGYQNYSADFNLEHIAKELTKREKKKLGIMPLEN